VLATDAELAISSVTPDFKTYYVLGDHNFYVTNHKIDSGDVSAVIDDPILARTRDIVLLVASVILGFSLPLFFT
jgi:hypothetical protein